MLEGAQAKICHGEKTQSCISLPKIVLLNEHVHTNGGLTLLPCLMAWMMISMTNCCVLLQLMAWMMISITVVVLPCCPV